MGGGIRSLDKLPLVVGMKKSLGQHWLNDQVSLEKVYQAAYLTPGDRVIEIGPGSGNLTKLLIDKGAIVTAVEIDTRLALKLQSLSLPNLEVINQDILDFDFSVVKGDYKIIANIPYFITDKIIRHICSLANKPSLAVMLIQKEVADKLTAKQGNMTPISLMTQFYFKVEKLDIVTPDKFTPSPKVDSQIVRLEKKKELSINKEDQSNLFNLIDIGFRSKRKTLVNNLTKLPNIQKDKLMVVLRSLNLNSLVRPQELGLDDWININNHLKTKNY